MWKKKSRVDKAKSHFENANHTETNTNEKQTNVLPMIMAWVKVMIDPSNHKNYFIFGSKLNNQCWYFNHETHSFNKINDIPKYHGYNCAMFETIKDGNTNKYALIYGENKFVFLYV